MARYKISERSQIYAASQTRVNADLYRDLGLKDVVVVRLMYVFRAEQVSTAGGAISGFHRDAPAGMIVNAHLYGAYKPMSNKRRSIHNMPAQQMYWAGSYEQGAVQAMLTTSAGASSTDPIRATIPVPLMDKHSRKKGMTYLDTRDYGDFMLDLQMAADADLATTNLSAVNNEEVEVIATVIEDPPPRGTPHYEPSVVYKELALDSASTKLTENQELTWDGLLAAILLQQHDDSAAGNAERVNAILRKFSIVQNGRGLVDDTRWDVAFRRTLANYPFGLTTTENAGIVVIPIRPHAKSFDGQALLRRDTQSAAALGITAVTPAANDRLFVTLLAAEPVHGASWEDD